MRKLKREAEEGAVAVRLRDGSARNFDDNTAFAEMFLARIDLLKGVSRDSEVLDAVRNATPESREAFEREYEPIEMQVAVVASPAEGGWVEVHTLSEDGAVGKVRHEGAARRPRGCGGRPSGATEGPRELEGALGGAGGALRGRNRPVRAARGRRARPDRRIGPALAGRHCGTGCSSSAPWPYRLRSP